MLELTALEGLFTHSIKQVLRNKYMAYGCQFSYLIYLEVSQPLAEINPPCVNRARFCTQLDYLLK